MGKIGPGAASPSWKGGRVLASNGYILIKVGVGHHLADVRGYAYEHRIVAEKKLGRRLEPGEIVHHVDTIKTNNAPSNLEVIVDIASHRAEHRAHDRGLRLPGQPNDETSCACGCGETFPRFDSCGRPRRFKTGHNMMNGGRLGRSA